MIIDRINKLLAACHMPRVADLNLHGRTIVTEADGYYRYDSNTPAHDIIDVIDRHAGIITRFKLDGSPAPVGERVRRLERHMAMKETPPFFWLGAIHWRSPSALWISKSKLL